MYSRDFENVTEAVAISDREVEFRFSQKGNRELPKILGDLVVLPKHWWEGTDAHGKKRDITRGTPGAAARFGRLQDCELQAGLGDRLAARARLLGRQAAVKIGRENFDTQRFTYILDDNAAWGRPSRRAGSTISSRKTARRSGRRSMISRRSGR